MSLTILIILLYLCIIPVSLFVKINDNNLHFFVILFFKSSNFINPFELCLRNLVLYFLADSLIDLCSIDDVKIYSSFFSDTPILFIIELFASVAEEVNINSLGVTFKIEAIFFLEVSTNFLDFIPPL